MLLLTERSKGRLVLRLRLKTRTLNLPTRNPANPMNTMSPSCPISSMTILKQAKPKKFTNSLRFRRRRKKKRLLSFKLKLMTHRSLRTPKTMRTWRPLRMLMTRLRPRPMPTKRMNLIPTSRKQSLRSMRLKLPLPSRRKTSSTARSTRMSPRPPLGNRRKPHH